MSNQRDKTALITGGGRGIGFAVAKKLTEQNIKCILLDLSDDIQEIAKSLSENNRGYKVDVSDYESLINIYADIFSYSNNVDILINSAGITGTTIPSWEITPDEVQKVMNINFMGTYYNCHCVIPVMLKQDWGRIINIASIAGKEGNPNLAAYSSSKAAVMALTKSLGKELAQSQILVNAIAPAVIETEMNKDVSEEVLEYMKSKIPMGRFGKTEEVAHMVQFLVSEEFGFSTGAVYDLSGGRATY